MKDVSQTTACVMDYGSFVWLANDLGKSFKKVYIHTPFEEEFHALSKCCIGDGLEGCERLDDYMDPEIFNTIQLWIFPDICYVGFQKYLRSIGKAVWGSFQGTDLELSRTKFLEFVESLNIPVAPYEVATGLTELAELLKKTKEPKWCKVNRFRQDRETFQHTGDWKQSERIIDNLAVKWFGLKDEPVFVVQDVIETSTELGYDGMFYNGDFPEKSFQGYELKNQAYLGSLLKYSKLPKELRDINAAIAPYLKRIGYCNFLATEVRVAKDGTAYFIDPTFRLYGQTGEHIYETCVNLAEVMLAAANGIRIEPKFSALFVAEATMHWTGDAEGGKALEVPAKAERWSKFYHYCQNEGRYHFPPRDSDELGVIIGTGNTINGAIKAVNRNFEAFESQPISIKAEGFAKLLTDIHKSEAKGVEFTSQTVPKPESAIVK